MCVLKGGLHWPIDWLLAFPAANCHYFKIHYQSTCRTNAINIEAIFGDIDAGHVIPLSKKNCEKVMVVKPLYALNWEAQLCAARCPISLFSY